MTTDRSTFAVPEEPGVQRPAATTMRRYGHLFVVLCGVSVHRLTTYRVDFLVGVSSFVVRIACQVALLSVIFGYVDSLAGWNYDQILLLLGFALLPRGLDRLVTDQLWILSWQLVRNGEVFRYLIRPVHPLFLLLSERFLYPDGIGELILGGAIIATAVSGGGAELTLTDWLLIPMLVVCAALIHAAIKCIVASLAFWTSSSLQMLSAVNQLSDFAAYPMAMYHPALSAVLTWVVPYAFTAAIPVQYLLFGGAGWLLVLPMTALLVTLAAVVFARGIRRFEMTGS